MTDRMYQFVVSIVSIAIAIGVRKFLPIADQNQRTDISLVLFIFLVMLFGYREAFNGFKSFAFQLLKSILLVIAAILFLRIIDLLPL